MYVGTPPFSKADSKDAYYKLLINKQNDKFWNAHKKFKEDSEYFSKEFIDFMN